MVDFDRDWDQLPIAELQRLDALCDRFERAIADDPETRIEQFVDDLPESQQRLVVRELMQVEIERRHARGELAASDEYARRFPKWADELRQLASEVVGSGGTGSETIDETAATEADTTPSAVSWADEWRASTAQLTPADLPSDGVLGHYQLQSVIGRGGMGLVVRARDTKLARDVAIKILAPQISRDASVNQRFLREAQAVAAIRHNHVVTIHAVETIDRIPFLVMEFVNGPTLEEHLRSNGKLAANEVVTLAHQMAQGLAAAHKQELIHRDVKPANILLEQTDATWHVKITDFGLARVAAEARLTRSGMIAGTPQYMSPEQANGQEIDCRSDLFSLGSVMYMMCAGRPPFEAESAVGVLRQVADMPVPPLHEVSPETPDWLIAIIEKLVAKSPDDRFQSAAEVADLLGRHLHEGISRGAFAQVPGDDDRTDANAFRLITRRHSKTFALTVFTIVGIATAFIVGKLALDRGWLDGELPIIPEVEVAKLLPTDGTAGAQFGFDISFSPDTAVIGAPYDNQFGEKAGAAYVFTRDDTGWIQQTRLTVPDAAANDWFGYSVSISGDTLAVSSSKYYGRPGAVYVFTRSGTIWKQQAKLTADDSVEGDGFGKHVVLQGETLLIGAPGATIGPAYAAGAAYVFVQSGEKWTQHAKLVASDPPGVRDSFGFRVDLHDDTAVVGAWKDDNTFTDSGSAYVFTRSGATWTQQAKLTAADPTNVDGGDVFGHSVALHEDTIVVGASTHDDPFTNSGAVCLHPRRHDVESAGQADTF